MKKTGTIIRIETNDKTLSALAGNKLGRMNYQEYAGKYFQDNDLALVTVEFPDNIEAISISYVQGFCDALIKKYGKQFVHDHLKVKAKTDKLADRFKRNILV